MPRLESFERQPNFPNEDLRDTNIAMVEYYLRETRPEESYAQFLRSSLGMVHKTGHYALRFCGIKVDYSEAEYEAFCRGFATFETVSLLVNPRPYDGTLAVRNTDELLVRPGDMADLDMSVRHGAWKDMNPNTYGVIINAGDYHGESMKQLHARTIGAQFAAELQSAA